MQEQGLTDNLYVSSASQTGTRSPREIYFYAPGLKRYETEEFYQRTPEKFIALSLTGSDCSLDCDHCQGQLLSSMKHLSPGTTLFEMCENLAKAGTQGVLISGGSDPRGRVPLLGFVEEMGRIKEELSLQVLVHTGLVDEETAQALGRAGIDGALIDIIGSDRTIAEVYHLPATIEDYEESLRLLTARGIPTMPHIVLGLHYGRLMGEEAALDMVARYPVAALVLVVIMPLDGTPMDGIEPPSLEDIAAFFQKARATLPNTPIVLGCARPPGERKVAIDRLAVDAGFDGIAYPAEGTIEYARGKGLRPHLHETCCALFVPPEGEQNLGGRASGKSMSQE